MDSFRFSPELFQHRGEAMERLEQSGYCWLSHYLAVDCMHDVYGIEVCGIHEKDDAQAILKILKIMFPRWTRRSGGYRDDGCEPGWRVKIFRDQPQRNDQWKNA